MLSQIGGVMVEVRLMTPADAEAIGGQQLKQPARLRVLTSEELVTPHAVFEEAVETGPTELSFSTIEEVQGSSNTSEEPEEGEEGEEQELWSTRDQDQETNPWNQTQDPPSSSEDDDAEGNSVAVELLVPTEEDDTQGQMVQPVRPPRPIQTKVASSSSLETATGLPRNKSSNISLPLMVGIVHFFIQSVDRCTFPACFFFFFLGHTNDLQ